MHQTFMTLALEEAKKGFATGGIPIGSVLVKNGEVIAQGHNQRIQQGSAIHHAEMNCLENAGRLKPDEYAQCTIYTTLSPCPMCSGAIVLYKIPRVIVGENRTFMGAEDYLRANGITVEVLDNQECFSLMQKFISLNPNLWKEDIGEE